MKNQPTFYLDDDTNKPIRAGGIIFYKFQKTENDDNSDNENNKNNEKPKEEIVFLMIRNRNLLEDFGGQTDEADKTYLDTVVRETDEESNGIFKRKKLINRLKDEYKYYNPLCKYIVYFVKLKNDEKEYDPEIFGDKETHRQYIKNS